MINNITEVILRTEVMKDFFGTEIKIGDTVAFTNPISSRKSLALGKVTTIGKSFAEIEFENPYYDGDIYPNKYDHTKKRPENIIVKP